MTQEHQQIDRYIIRRVLGTGAMGSVYAAWDPKLHREVALKVVPQRLSMEPKGRERFHREARAIAAVRHPNIVEIYDYSGNDSKYLYLVIEKLDGEDLYATLHRNGMMGEQAAAAIGHELCSALQVAHEAGIIHRDLKPENVFLNSTGRVVLTDFGIVKAIRWNAAVDGYKENTDVIGTPGFMAPELMSGRGLGPPIDVFALGALLYNITTKRLPYDGSTPLDIFKAAAAGRFEDPRKHNPNLSEEFCTLVAECLHPNPKKRPRSAEMVRQTLKGILEENGITEVRDDLRSYAQNGDTFTQMAHTRTVRYLVQQIKIAAKDHDTQAMQRHRARLAVLDPYNDDLKDISGVARFSLRRPVNASSSRRLHAWLKAFTSGALNTWKGLHTVLPRWAVLWAVGALIVGGAVGLYRWQHQRNAWRGNAVELTTVPLTPAPSQLATADLPQPANPAAPQQQESPDAGGSSLQRDSRGSRDEDAHDGGSNQNAQVDVRVTGGIASLIIDGVELGKTSHRAVQLQPGHHVFEVTKNGRGCKRIITLAAGDHLSIRADPRHRQINVQ